MYKHGMQRCYPPLCYLSAHVNPPKMTNFCVWVPAHHAQDCEQTTSKMAQVGVDDSQRNLIVNYLPSSLTPAAFKNMFAPFGEIESCRIISDKATGTYLDYFALLSQANLHTAGQSQGFGFVKFASNDAAAKAIQIMNGRNAKMNQNNIIFHKINVGARTNIGKQNTESVLC